MRLRYKFLVAAFSSAMLMLGCAPTKLMVETSDEPCLKTHGKNGFLVCENLNFRVEKQDYFVPMGYRTDLSSIPFLGLPLSAAFKTHYMSSGIIHDYLYDCKSPFTRNEADNIFYNMLLSDGMPEKQAKALYYLMVLAGWNYYSGDKQCHIGAYE